MGIESTYTITRDQAIGRIEEVYLLLKSHDLKTLESLGCESEVQLNVGFARYVLREFEIAYNFGIYKLTNKMLEDLIDLPFVRFSMFENYQVVDDVY